MGDVWEESLWEVQTMKVGSATCTSNARAHAGPPVLYSFSEPEPETLLPLPVLPLTAYHRKLTDRALWEQLADSLPAIQKGLQLGRIAEKHS